MFVQHFLENSASRVPDKIALVCDGRRLSYRELDDMANRLAHALRDMGVRRGDRVGVFLNNSVEAVVSIFAALKAGGVFVPLNHTAKRDQLQFILNHCHATVLIAEANSETAAFGDESVFTVPSLKGLILCGPQTNKALPTFKNCLSFEHVLSHYPASKPCCHNIDLDLAFLIYTSGTTGDPKGVMSDHSNVVFVSKAIIEYLKNAETDIILNALPLSYSYGLYQLLMVCFFGGTLVLEKSFAFPAVFMQLIEKERVTGFPGVPTMYAMLVSMDLSRFDLSSLRYFTNAAAALPPSHILEIRKKLPRAKLYSMYGLTETARTLYLPPEELDRRPGSVGIAIPGTETWVEDDQGRRLGPGQIGELVVRGRHVMRGYWDAPEATAQRYRPGPVPNERLCYTGDLFRTDEEGFYYFIGRKDDIIKCRGEKVAPKEVEHILYGLKGVREAAVVGIPDAVLGQAIKAFIVPADGQLTSTQVLAHCHAHLKNYMMPKYVEFRRELPKTSSGKITKIGLI